MPRPIRLAALATSLALATAAVSAEPLRIIALGDMPYLEGDAEEDARKLARYRALAAAIDAAAPDLVIHIGDIKASSERCDDALLAERLAMATGFAAPTLYTPGDNEWTDCGKKKAGRFDTRERLAFLRGVYPDAPETTFGGRRLPVATQRAAGLPENARLEIGGVMVATVHVVGSKNNRDDDRDEHEARAKANEAWLEQAFAAARARGAKAVVIAIHADIFRDGMTGKELPKKKSGFRRFGKALQKEAAAHGGPVLLVYGDNHDHRIHDLMPDRAPNLKAVQVFGPEEMDAVAITADPGGGAAFAVAPFHNPMR